MRIIHEAMELYVLGCGMPYGKFQQMLEGMAEKNDDGSNI